MFGSTEPTFLHSLKEITGCSWVAPSSSSSQQFLPLPIVCLPTLSQNVSFYFTTIAIIFFTVKREVNYFLPPFNPSKVGGKKNERCTFQENCGVGVFTCGSKYSSYDFYTFMLPIYHSPGSARPFSLVLLGLKLFHSPSTVCHPLFLRRIW